jgi:hypothetical protein
MSNLVVVKRVAFGTPEFMFLRTDINLLMKERLILRKLFSSKEERYRWICNTIRAMADLVYFLPKEKKLMDARVNISPANKPVYLSKKQQEQLTKSKLKESQKQLF